MYTCTRDHTCSRYYSKSRLFRLRANIGCPTFLVYEQLQCYHVNVYIYSHACKKNIQTHQFHAFLFHSAYKLFLQENKNKKNSPREIRTYTVPVICYCPTPKPLHYRGRYCPTATHIRDYISNNLISSYIRRKLAKTTDNRSEIKLAYATPFELQGQKNTTI